MPATKRLKYRFFVVVVSKRDWKSGQMGMRIYIRFALLKATIYSRQRLDYECLLWLIQRTIFIFLLFDELKRALHIRKKNHFLIFCVLRFSIRLAFDRKVCGERVRGRGLSSLVQCMCDGSCSIWLCARSQYDGIALCFNFGCATKLRVIVFHRVRLICYMNMQRPSTVEAYETKKERTKTIRAQRKA